MHQKKTRIHQLTESRGSSIIIAVGITGLIFTITLSLSVVILATFRGTTAVGNGNKAFYAAEAGVEEALYMIAGHGPGFQFDATLNAADDFTGSACLEPVMTTLSNGAVRDWNIDSRVALIDETALEANERIVLNLHRDPTCPYVTQPLDPAAAYDNLIADDFNLDVYYQSAECPTIPDPSCPTEIVGDTLVALAGTIPVSAEARPVTVSDDEVRLDDPLETASVFRIYDDDGNSEWEPNQPVDVVGESLYDNVGGGWALIVDHAVTPPASDPIPPPPGLKPFATNISSDASTLYDSPPVTSLQANLYVDHDDSGTVSSALASRWIASAKDDATSTEQLIQFDIDSDNAVDESYAAPVFSTASTGNRSPDTTTQIIDLLDSSYHEGKITLFSFPVRMYYKAYPGASPSTPEPLPVSTITVSAEGHAGVNVQILQTEIEQVGTTPIFSKTVVF